MTDEGLLDPGIVVLCDTEGRVRRILRDDIGASLHPGRSLPDWADWASQDKARNFLGTLVAEGAALDWQLHLTAATDQVPPLALHLAGLAVSDGFLLAGAQNFPAAARLLAALLPRDMPDGATLAAVLRELSRGVGERGQQDAALFDELSRLNNELITAQRELARRNAELARLNAEKNQFLGMAAHELRNPLTIILAYSEYLNEDASIALSSRNLRFLDTIRRSSEFMSGLIDDLLDISKIEAGKLVLNRAPTDLSRLVEENVALNRVLAERQQLRLVCETDENLPILWLDAMKIEQVLNNLIGNALKASPPGQEVRVELIRDPQGALIRVEDQGPGIVPEEMDAIFTPFRQGHLGKVAGGKSAGLGLAIASSIVRGHGGRLWAENRAPKGASFFVLLPLALAPATVDIAR